MLVFVFRYFNLKIKNLSYKFALAVITSVGYSLVLISFLFFFLQFSFLKPFLTDDIRDFDTFCLFMENFVKKS